MESASTEPSDEIEVSLVIPVLDEEHVIQPLLSRVASAFENLGDPSREIIFVDDGSADSTFSLLREALSHDPRLVVVKLSRNFGHQAAITAGLHTARGRCAIVMDADLQDPPEVIPELVRQWREGYQVVVAERRSRGESTGRRALFAAFYRVLDALADPPMPMRAGVFGLMDRRVVEQLVGMRERNRFIPGLRSWVGFRQTSVPYDRADRAVGAPKQTFGKLLRYAFDAIFSFSYKPLRLSWVIGSIVSLLCFAYAGVLLLLRILEINVVRGFTTPTVLILLLGGIQLIAIGVLGEYLARIYDELKGRPLFVIDEVLRHSSNRADATKG